MYMYNNNNQREPKWWCGVYLRVHESKIPKPTASDVMVPQKKVGCRSVREIRVSTTDGQRRTRKDQWIKRRK